MGELTVRIEVTQKSFDENATLDDWFNFGQLTNREMFDFMSKFIVNEKGEPATEEEKRKLFKSIKRGDWAKTVAEFSGKVRDAFVNPTSGGS